MINRKKQKKHIRTDLDFINMFTMVIYRLSKDMGRHNEQKLKLQGEIKDTKTIDQMD